MASSLKDHVYLWSVVAFALIGVTLQGIFAFQVEQQETRLAACESRTDACNVEMPPLLLLAAGYCFMAAAVGTALQKGRGSQGYSAAVYGAATAQLLLALLLAGTFVGRGHNVLILAPAILAVAVAIFMALAWTKHQRERNQEPV